MTRHRVRCADCGSVVFDGVYTNGLALEMPICINRIKPGAGPCERDFALEGRLASEARHGGRVLTSNLCAYLLPRDNPSALIIQESMRDATPEKWADLWRSHFDPAGGLVHYASWMADGPDNDDDRLPMDAVAWPVYRAALA